MEDTNPSITCRVCGTEFKDTKRVKLMNPPLYVYACACNQHITLSGSLHKRIARAVYMDKLKKLVWEQLGLQYLENPVPGKWRKLRAALFNSPTPEDVVKKMREDPSYYREGATHWRVCWPSSNDPEAHVEGRIAVVRLDDQKLYRAVAHYELRAVSDEEALKRASSVSCGEFAFVGVQLIEEGG